MAEKNIVGTLDRLKPGDHLGFMYDSEEQRSCVVGPFIVHGLEQGQKVLYLLADHSREQILEGVRSLLPDVQKYLKKEQFVFTDSRELTHLKNQFDPEQAIQRLKDAVNQAEREGYPVLRVVTEMNWAGEPQNASRTRDFESRLNQYILSSRHMLVLCLYDCRLIDPAALLDPVRSHPLIAVNHGGQDTDIQLSETFIKGERFAKTSPGDDTHANRPSDGFQFLATVLENVRDVIVVTDLHGKVTYWNQAASEVLGYSAEEMLNRFPDHLFPTGSSEDYLKVLTRIAAGEQLGGEYLIPGKSGRLVWMDLQAHFLQDEQGQMIGFMCTAQDISARKLAEDKLQQNEMSLIEAQNLAHLGSYSVDIRTGKMSWSEEAFRILGMSPQEKIPSVEEFMDRMVHPDHYHSVKKAVLLAVRNSRPFDHHCYVYGGDGILRYIHSVGRPVAGEDGHGIRVIGTIMDETDRKDTETAMQESEKRWRSAVEGSGDGLWDYDVLNQRVYYSAGWKSILGYGEDELSDSVEEWSNRIHPDDFAQTLNTLQRHLNGEIPTYQSEHRLIGKDGRYHWVFDRGSVISRDEYSHPVRMIGTNAEITSRKKTETSLKRYAAISRAVSSAAEKFLMGDWRESIQGVLQELGEAAAVGRVYLSEVRLEPEGWTTFPQYEWVRAGEKNLMGSTGFRFKAMKVSGYRRWEKLLGQKQVIVAHVRDLPEEERLFFRQENIQSILVVPIFTGKLWKGMIGIDSIGEERVWTDAEINAMEAAANIIGAAMTRQQGEEALRESEERYRTFLQTFQGIAFRTSLEEVVLFIQGSVKDITGYASDELMGKHHRWLDIVHPEDRHLFRKDIQKLFAIPDCSMERDYRIICKDGQERWVHELANTISDENGKPLFYQGTIYDRTQAHRAEDELKEVQELFAVFMDHLPAGAFIQDEAGSLEYINPYLLSIFGKSSSEAANVDTLEISKLADSILSKCVDVQSRTPVMSSDHVSDWMGVSRWYETIRFPIHRQGKPSLIGGIAVDITPRKQAEDQIERQLKRLTAMRAVDMIITASLDMRLTLQALLEQVVQQLGVDAADVLILNTRSQTLDYASGRGFRTQALQHTHLRVGEGYAGKVALARQKVVVNNLNETPDELIRAPMVSAEGFVAYFGFPLIAKGQVEGVLEIFNRRQFSPDEEWMEFLESLARQAAIAIDNTLLFENLQRANVDLVLAYDATIEGWSRALDLRDRETEGHTQRVTELTIKLARMMIRNDEEQVHIRRGALLHDIGKMGIPDNILLKPGPLTDDEWEVMRRHPFYAYELLAPIPFLRPALDIPYCHHEKWDGSGYPRGLKGEEIPLAARIFAVVDVWDALCSDRPYRQAWEPARAMQYILGQSEHHFDPKVVASFLELKDELFRQPF